MIYPVENMKYTVTYIAADIFDVCVQGILSPLHWRVHVTQTLQYLTLVVL